MDTDINTFHVMTYFLKVSQTEYSECAFKENCKLPAVKKTVQHQSKQNPPCDVLTQKKLSSCLKLYEIHQSIDSN